MKLPLLTDGCALPVSYQLIEILESELQKANKSQHTLDNIDAITFNFRDPEYSPESGGYHPVEIRLSQDSGDFQLDYITDFSYVGSGWDTELAKEIDFDLLAGVCEVRHFKAIAIESAVELFSLFQDNFLSYFQMDVFSVEVTVQDRG